MDTIVALVALLGCFVLHMLYHYHNDKSKIILSSFWDLEGLKVHVKQHTFSVFINVIVRIQKDLSRELNQRLKHRNSKLNLMLSISTRYVPNTFIAQIKF